MLLLVILTQYCQWKSCQNVQQCQDHETQHCLGVIGVAFDHLTSAVRQPEVVRAPELFAEVIVLAFEVVCSPEQVDCQCQRQHP